MGINKLNLNKKINKQKMYRKNYHMTVLDTIIHLIHRRSQQYHYNIYIPLYKFHQSNIEIDLVCSQKMMMLRLSVYRLLSKLIFNYQIKLLDQSKIHVDAFRKKHEEKNKFKAMLSKKNKRSNLI